MCVRIEGESFRERKRERDTYWGNDVGGIIGILQGHGGD